MSKELPKTVHTEYGDVTRTQPAGTYQPENGDQGKVRGRDEDKWKVVLATEPYPDAAVVLGLARPRRVLGDLDD
ncbi:MAG: hypothetical protein AAB909_03990 [Patescibacteria group bacterium]